MSRFAARAFTLIEVLISIVVLALGLLGLAAIFPVVVYQQRMAVDTVQGVSMSNSAVAWIAGNAALNERGPFHDDFAGLDTPSNRRGWERLVCDTNFSRDGEWIPALPANDPRSSDNFFMDSDGVVTITGGFSDTDIPPGQRLAPSPYAGMGFPSAAEPRYVWDLALRRLDAGRHHDAADTHTYYDDSIQAAVFIRRVDPGIRVKAKFTLGQVLSGLNITGLTPGDRRIPVAEDRRARPTNDGVGGTGDATQPVYSPIRIFKFRPQSIPDTNPAEGNNWISLDLSYDPNGTMRDVRPFILRVGQKFVDIRGVVHTVTELVKDAGTTPPSPIPNLRVSPGFFDGDVAMNSNVGDQRFNELLYTPQIPVAVRVVTLGAGTGSGISPGAMP